MKQLGIFLLISLGIALTLAGCKKEPIDRDIEKMWKLEEFTTHADGTVHRDCQRIYFSIQLWVVELAEKNCTHGYPTCIGRFIYGDDKQTVTMKDFKYRSSTGDNGQDVSVDDLLHYGINSPETTFRILKADGKHLELESDYATLRFTSF